MLVRYQNQDCASGAILIERLSPQFFQYFLAQIRNRSHAEDMLQDFWLRIHNSRHTYRGGEPVLPWLYAIARRVKVDDYRKTKRLRAEETLTDDLVSDSPVPEKCDTRISKLLKQLPESQREAILMMKVGGLTLEEVARATGATVGSVKQKVHRGYERLRALMMENRA